MDLDFTVTYSNMLCHCSAYNSMDDSLLLHTFPHTFTEHRRAMIHTGKARFVLLILERNPTPSCTNEEKDIKDITQRLSALTLWPSVILMVSEVLFFDPVVCWVCT